MSTIIPLDQMTTPEKLRLMEELWANLARDEREFESPAWHESVLREDVDFSNRIMLSAPPPWIVHLRIGNLRRREFHAFLVRIWPEVEALLPAHKLVNVYEDRIEAIG